MINFSIPPWRFPCHGPRLSNILQRWQCSRWTHLISNCCVPRPRVSRDLKIQDQKLAREFEPSLEYI